jgi:hypothetical protein
VGQPYKLLSNDLLYADSTISVEASSGGTTIGSGMVSGGAPFVVTEVPGTSPVDLRVDLEWTCGTVPPGAIVTPPRGYVFKMSDHDCVESWPQKVVLRPRPSPGGPPTHIDVSLYGAVYDSVAVPLTNVGGSLTFSFQAYDLNITGTLLSFDNVDAEIQVTDFSWGGEDICEPGLYTLPVAA